MNSTGSECLEFLGVTVAYDIVRGLTGLLALGSLPLYLFVIIVMIRYSRQLNSSFFTTAISAGFADVAGVLVPITLFPFRNYDIIYIAVLYVTFLQIAGAVLMTVNRYAALTKPLRYDTVRKFRLWYIR